MILNWKLHTLLFALLFFSGYSAISQGIKGKDARRHSIQIMKDEGRETREERRGTKAEGRENDDATFILMVGQEPLISSDPELLAAMDFIRELEGYSLKYSTFHELKRHPKQLQDAAVVWFHRSDTSNFTTDESDGKVIKLLREYLEKGGKILLTLDAFRYINLLGIETTIPSVRQKSSVDEGYGRKLGFHAFREHPVFTGIYGGAYIYKPIKDLTLRVNGFFGDTVPEKGKVVAIDWDYIFFREDSKMVVEYDVGKGKLLGVGAYTLFSQPNENRLHLETFSKNALDYLAGKLEAGPRFYWDYSPDTVVQCRAKTDIRRAKLKVIPKAVTWDLKPPKVAFSPRTATNNYCEAAGEGILIMGAENGGIEEVWTHPFMSLRDYSVSITINGPDNSGHIGTNPSSENTIWLSRLSPEIEIRPDCFIRYYHLYSGLLTEVVAAHPTKPVGVVHYTWDGAEPAVLSIHFMTNLRIMWPYPAATTVSLCHGWDHSYQAFYFMNKSGDFAVMAGGNKIPYRAISKKGGDLLADAQVHYSMNGGESLDFVFASSAEGLKETTAIFDEAILNPMDIFQRSQKHAEEVFANNLMITSPDSNFNAGYRWALIGTDRFFVTTPGMGSGLVAGYGTTRSGWDGAQKVNGRPGYAWYFGRDGQWSGFALLDIGDFDKVKKNLEFYLKYQDLSGKIFHEATTSGVIHYDASDATPLFIILAGRYLLHSGDTSFIQENWSGIKKAITFCFSTDTDKDHLIENTNVGHGWVEGGQLFGSHSSFYLTGCWVAALEGAATMAQVVNDPSEELYIQEAKIVRDLIDEKFWNGYEQFYSFGRNKDGSQRTDQTILPTVPAYFGITDKYKMRNLLDKYASNAFSTNWGTRIIGEDNPMFKPTGYHYGSVWPLFTGWTALAEYEYGNYTQGFTHIMNNLNVYRNWVLGFVEEVLNGAEYQPSGVCPHQCWSETMVLQPAIEGMLGIEADAPNNTLYISPRLPADWDWLTVERIRLGNQFVDLAYKRDSSAFTWHFEKTGNQAVTINFMPALFPGTKITRILLNGEAYPFATFTTSRFISLHMSFIITGIATIEVEVAGGISVLPLIPYPAPGDQAEGMRIIDATLRGNQYIINLEGMAGSSDTLSVWSYNPVIEATPDAHIIGRNGCITKILVDFAVANEKYSRKELTLIFHN